jgi:serine/threonine-protein kinase HipA
MSTLKANITGHVRNKINVSIKFSDDEIEVGKLILDNRQVYFKYDDDFLERGLNLSPLRLQFNNSIQFAKPEPFQGIFGVFDDSLPDGWGKLLLNRALEKEGLSLNDITILDQLAYVGETGRGALIYRPAIMSEENFSDHIDIDKLKTDIDQVYKGTSEDVIEELIHLGGSSGGARPKANVGYNPKTDELIHGKNNLPEGFEHWIIKFPNSEDPFDIANIEYAYHKMALAANIEMSECKLFESKKGLQIFGTKRFDRIGNNRLHMHSMAGLTHDNFRRSSIDYGHVIDTAYTLEQSAAARKKVLRLAAFNVYSHNRDDHSKNFSWLMDDAGNWTFAPAYDLTYSSTAIGEHSTRIAGEGAYPGRKNILALAREFSISKPNEIIEEVQDAISEWPKMAKACGVGKASLNRIQKKFNQLTD